MMNEDILDIVLDRFEAMGIRYMVTGSFAGNLYGIPRVTHDADIVIEADASLLGKFIHSLHGEFFADESMALEALQHQSMFNVIHLHTGFKIDLIPRKERTFSREEFRRRKEATVSGKRRWFSSPEDTLLTKLEWSTLSESERQFNDAVSIAKIQADSLDWKYIERWAQELDLSSLVRKLSHETGRT